MSKEETVLIAFRATERDRDVIERAMFDLGLVNRSEIMRRIIRDWEKFTYSPTLDNNNIPVIAEQ